MRVLSILTRAMACSALLIFGAFLVVPKSNAQTFSFPPFPANGAAGLTTNSYAGNATVANNVLQLTSSGGDQVGSAWYVSQSPSGAYLPTPLVTGFNSTFTFQFTNPGGISNNGKTGADGIAFVVQNGSFNGFEGDKTSGGTALAPNDGLGGNIGFTGLTKSVAIEFDSWCNTDYGDVCASGNSPTSADQLSIQSCGANANNANHNAGCTIATVDLSTLATPIYIGDGTVHTAQVSYNPPATPTGSCPPGSASGSSGCGSLAVILDGQTVLVVPFNLNYLGLDTNNDAFVGFTGATGGSFETQVVTTWNFMANVSAVVSQPVPIPQGPGTNVNLLANFSNTDGTTLQTDILYTLPNTTITPSPNAPTPLIVTTNTTFDPTKWPEYVIGTPWAMSNCSVKAANGGTGLCSLYTNACYQSGTDPSLASDAYCPTVTEPDENNYILLEDTFDWGGGKWAPTQPGTTASLIAFSVPTSTPGLLWTASLPPAITNPVCPTQVSSTPTACYLSDTLIDIFGDQTTTRGSKPKAKAWLVTAVNVLMPTTTVSITSPGAQTCTAPSAATWNNGACVMDFIANPAGGSAMQPPSTGNNYFQAAEPAYLVYGFLPGANAGAPAIGPGPLPSGDKAITNPSPVLTCSGSPSVCGATPWDTGVNSALSTIFGSSNGQFTLHYSSRDTAGITEKNIQLNPAVGDTCPTPNGPVTNAQQLQCYTTSYFTTQVNIDSNAPAVSTCTPTPASPSGNGWYNTDVVNNCTAADNLSGIQSATPAITGVPAAGTTPVNFTLATSVGASSNPAASTGSEQLCDYANNCSTTGPLTYSIDAVAPQISLSFLSNSQSYPNGSTFTQGQAVTVVYTCTDTGSGVGNCAGFASSCPGMGKIGSSPVSPAGATVSTSAAGPHTLPAVSASDCAGNASSPLTPTYTVTSSPSVDVGIYGLVKTNTSSSIGYRAWALDLSATSPASNVVMTIQVSALSAGVIGGPVSGTVAIVSCTLLPPGCSETPPTGTSCTSVSSPPYTSSTLTCNVGTLPSAFKLQGARAIINIPVAVNAKPNSMVSITSTVVSANDPNTKNNMTTLTVGVK
jgi:hypothetical protein